MNNPVQLLMTDSSHELLDHCRDAMGSRGVQVKGCTADGRIVYDEISRTQPDVVLLDVIMPGMDAITLKYRYDQEHPGAATSFYATGTMRGDSIESELFDHGFKFYFLKPFDPGILSDWILSGIEKPAAQRQAMGAPGGEVMVAEMLRSIGVPAHVMGYRYLRDAILMVVEKPDMIHAVTKELYPDVAKKYDTKATRVERAIRHAIEIAWDRGDLDIIDQYFGSTIDSMRGKPTNSEFIAMLAERATTAGPQSQYMRH